MHQGASGGDGSPTQPILNSRARRSCHSCKCYAKCILLETIHDHIMASPMRVLWVCCLLLVAACALASELDVEVQNTVELRQVERSLEHEQEWSTFVSGHHAELLELEVPRGRFASGCLPRGRLMNPALCISGRI